MIYFKLLILVCFLGSFNAYAFSNKNWGIYDTHSHIQALDAWKIAKSKKKVLVAVVDTGLDMNHPGLSQNVKKGWNFVDRSEQMYDDHGHGTHIAGIIGATFDASKGVSGVSQNVTILPVKFYSAKNSGSQNLSHTIAGIYYAVDHRAQIINYSGGGKEFSHEEYKALKYAEKKGVLVVAAAGNEHENTDESKNYYYPAGYGLSNIISVTAIDPQNQVLKSSNWGKKSVHIAAPGFEILSTLPNGKYGKMTGTSQATAFVSGVAASLLAERSSMTPAQIKTVILKSADVLPQLQEKVICGGKLNAFKAMQLAKSF